MKSLIFDTETTGLLLDARASDPGQPHIVQFAALLVDTDDSNNELECHNYLVKPDGWTISTESSEIHGITQERAEADGIPEIMVAQTMLRLVREADIVIAHNISFDRQIIRIALRRYGLMKEDETTWGIEQKQFCTMRAMTPICKLPSMRGSGYKWPKLTEAYRHCFSEDFDGAHDAMADLRATFRVWKWLQDQKGVAA